MLYVYKRWVFMFIILLRSESSIFFTVSPLHDVTCRERNSLFCFRFLSVDYMFSYLLLGLRVLFKNFSFPACSLKMMDCDDSSCDQYKHVYHACTIQTFSEDSLTVTLCVVSLWCWCLFCTQCQYALQYVLIINSKLLDQLCQISPGWTSQTQVWSLSHL